MPVGASTLAHGSRCAPAPSRIAGGAYAASVRIVEVTFRAFAGALPELARFYGTRLELDVAEHDGSVSVRFPNTRVAFVPDDGEPFYHFAVRVPRNRFEAACAWIEERAGLLADGDTGRSTFRFECWNADACYFEDPAGNVVELIAHHELPEESSSTGAFEGRELLGVCEVGLVGDDVRAMARPLLDAGVELWDGTLDDPDGLAFMGGRDGVLILAREGRPWMPTTRPAVRAEVNVAARRPAPRPRRSADHDAARPTATA